MSNYKYRTQEYGCSVEKEYAHSGVTELVGTKTSILVECCRLVRGMWLFDTFWGLLAYRAKRPRKIVTAMWAYEKGGKDGFCHPSNRSATHKITFKTVNGEPCLSSIKMEEV